VADTDQSRLAFHHFEVLRREPGGPLWELGRGNMGVTYKAFDTNLGRTVALKVINAANIDSESARERFRREAKAAAALSHPNVAGVYHLGNDENSFFYAMEFIDGETLESFVKRNGPMPAREALAIIAQVARALMAAHAKNLLHRDLKPANIMILPQQDGDDPLVKVIDFGLVKSLEGDKNAASLSQGNFVGTPQFASPEQFDSETDLDGRSDLYSLGVTLWYLLAGRAPFTGSFSQVIAQQLHKPPPFEMLANQPESVIALLRSLLAKDRDERPANANAVRLRISEILHEMGSSDSSAEAAAAATIMGTLASAPSLPKPPPTAGSSGVRSSSAVAPPPLPPPLPTPPPAGYSLEEPLRRNGRMRPAEVHALLLPLAGIVDAAPELEPLDLSPRGVRILPELFSPSNPRSAVLLDPEINNGRRCVIEVAPRPAGDGADAQSPFATMVQPTAATAVGGVPALAALVYELLSGAPPPASARGYRPLAEISEESNVVLQRALSAATAAAAFPDAAAFVETLAPILLKSGSSTVRPSQGSQAGTVMGAMPVMGSGAAVSAHGSASFPLPPPPPPPPVQMPSVSFPGNAPPPTWPPQPQPGSGVYPPYQPQPQQPPPRAAGAPTLQRGCIFAAIGAGLLGLMLIVTMCQLARHSSNVTLNVNDDKSPSASPRRQTSPTNNNNNNGERRRPEQEIAAARSAAAEEDYAAALAAYQRALALDPASSEASKGVRDSAQKLVSAAFKRVKTDPAKSAEWYRLAAEAGNADGQNNLGIMYENGQSVPKDYNKAVSWYRKAAEQGDARGQYYLGTMYEGGLGVPKDYPQALEWYRKSADQNYPDGQTAVGYMYANGLGVNRDYAQAVEYYRRAAEQGNARAQNNLGFLYNSGRGVVRDYALAATWYRKAAEQGNAAAQKNLGVLYEDGLGVPQNYTEAAAWHRKAAEQNFAEAQNRLGLLYLGGKGVEMDYNEAAKWFRKAADRNLADAQNNLGYLYEFGKGVPQNYAEAAAWYRKGAEGGDLYAQTNLGNLYRNGKGVPQDYGLAYYWFKKAADAGHPSAQNNLGTLYEYGQGVTKNAETALFWYRKAADQNDARGQYYVGTMYENGSGVPKDLSQAILWYQKAARNGNEQARERLKVLNKNW